MKGKNKIRDQVKQKTCWLQSFSLSLSLTRAIIPCVAPCVYKAVSRVSSTFTLLTHLRDP